MPGTYNIRFIEMETTLAVLKVMFQKFLVQITRQYDSNRENVKMNLMISKYYNLFKKMCQLMFHVTDDE